MAGSQTAPRTTRTWFGRRFGLVATLTAATVLGTVIAAAVAASAVRDPALANNVASARTTVS